MTSLKSASAALALSLSVLGLPAHGQIDPFKVKVFQKGGPATTKELEALGNLKHEAPPSKLPRLSSSEFSQLRAHLADQLKVSPSALSTIQVNASNLSTPGNMVHVQIGMPIPPGFSWNGRHLDAFAPSLWNSNGPAPGTSATSRVTFSATSAPQGTYLLTVFMFMAGSAPKFSSVNCRIFYGTNCASATPAAMVPVQAGKVMVPFVQPSTGCLAISVDMPWMDGSKQPLMGGIVACEFLRLQ